MTLTLTGIPLDVSANWNGALPGTVNFVGGIYEIDGSTPEVLALLASFTLSATTHDDTNFSVDGMSVYTEEVDGSNSTNTATHDITIQAVADAPNLNLLATPQGNEDTVIPVSINVDLVDGDTSETLNFVDIAGAYPPESDTDHRSFWYGNRGQYRTRVWRVTGPDADIQATLASGVSILPGTHVGTNVALTITAQSIESNPTEGGDVAVTTANTVLNVVVDVVPVADQPSAVGGAYSTEEDTAVALTGIGGALVDVDGSEIHTLYASNVPAGASFSAGTNSGGGVWSFTATHIASGISFTPPLNAHGVYNLTLTSIATETENSSQAINTAPITITVDAQADQPIISGFSQGLEDTSITFGDDIEHCAFRC
ncbi:MAG: hypothetical protein U5K75_11775 [Ahrensia sp.]|nr:hypothetical protein [Ahrensia sp.]